MNMPYFLAVRVYFEKEKETKEKRKFAINEGKGMDKLAQKTFLFFGYEKCFKH